MRYQTASDLFADLKRLRRNLGESFESSEMIAIVFKRISQEPNFASSEENPGDCGLCVLAVAILGGFVYAIYKMMPEAKANFSFANANRRE